jgi:TalC/MipB family fructose-6-phosphate aldolase
MKLLIDDANVAKIKHIYEFYPVDGVTTNPSILAKSGRNPYEVLKEIREFIGEEAELHAQVISLDAEGMVKEAEKMVSVLGKNTFIKIPTVPEGLKAMKILSARGFKITATAIYTPMQAYLAAKAGADYAAPYVNRIDNLGADGIASAKMIQDIYDNNGFKTQILAASFKNSNQVQELCAYGVGASTVAPDVIENLIKNACVTSAVQDFVTDFEKLCGAGKTMLDCE